MKFPVTSQDYYPEVSRPSYGLLAASLLIIGLLSSFLFFWRLGAVPLTNWDEGIHSEVTREMYRQGAWISLSYHDQLYTAKPPLRFWLTAATFPLLGQNEFALRFWSAVAGVAAALLITFWIFSISNSIRLAFLAGALFVTGRFVMYHAFRTGETDGLLVLLISAAMYAYWRSRWSSRWFIVFGIFVGLSAMTKSFAAAIPVLTALIDCWLARRWSSIGLKTVAIATGVAVAIAAPWHIFEIVKNGSAFWDGYFGFHVVDRATSVLYANNVSWWWYAEIIFKRTFPFGVFIPLALILAVRRWLFKRDALDRLLVLWFAVVFILFSLVKTKFDWYVLPLYPPLVMVLARGCSEFLHQQKDRLLVWAATLSFAAGIIVLPIGIAHEGVLWKLTPFAYVPTVFVNALWGRVIVSLVVTAVVVVITLILRTQTIIKPTRIVGMILIMYLVVMAGGWSYSYIKHEPSTSALKDIARELQVTHITDVDIVGMNMLTQPAGYYYLRSINGLRVHENVRVDAVSHAVILTSTDSSQYGSVLAKGSVILKRDHFALIRVATMEQ